MIQKFVDAWTKNRDLIQSWLEPICLYCDYSDIVKATVKAIALEATLNRTSRTSMKSMMATIKGRLFTSFPMQYKRDAQSTASANAAAPGLAMATGDPSPVAPAQPAAPYLYDDDVPF